MNLDSKSDRVVGVPHLVFLQVLSPLHSFSLECWLWLDPIADLPNPAPSSIQAQSNPRESFPFT